MIFCRDLDKSFDTSEDMFKAIIENKANLKALKKSAVKEADGFSCILSDTETKKGLVTKANEAVEGNPTEIKVRVVGNTTNLLDSHGDVHIDSLWKRTLKASDTKLHLQEHKRSFDMVISSDAKAYVKNTTFRDLGVDLDGNTQALMLDSTVKLSRNPLMFDQYKNGWVNNHSVGMQYVDMVVCINSEEKWAKEEKENWDKYYPMVANKDVADEAGYFWAVLEAKLVEVSAVLFGSNYATPTLENNLKSEESPSEKTESPDGTQKTINTFINLI